MPSPRAPYPDYADVVTHEYWILVGGTVMRGSGQPDSTAIAWAGDTILALGSDDEVRAISRGDSHVASLSGAVVSPVTSGSDPRPTPDGALDVGGAASFAILTERPPSTPEGHVDAGSVVAIVIRGRLTRGRLPPLLRS